MRFWRGKFGSRCHVPGHGLKCELGGWILDSEQPRRSVERDALEYELSAEESE